MVFLPPGALSCTPAYTRDVKTVAAGRLLASVFRSKSTKKHGPSLTLANHTKQAPKNKLPMTQRMGFRGLQVSQPQTGPFLIVGLSFPICEYRVWFKSPGTCLSLHRQGDPRSSSLSLPHTAVPWLREGPLHRVVTRSQVLAWPGLSFAGLLLIFTSLPGREKKRTQRNKGALSNPSKLCRDSRE